MSPVAINGIDKQGVYVNGVQVKQALSDANSTVNKGVYDATLLETVDADLAAVNIKSGITIFGKLGTLAPMDVSDADALVTDVKDPKTFYSVIAPRKTGTMPTVALNPALDEYPAGYHVGAASLHAVDADLAAANIKSGVTIFGILGTLTSVLSEDLVDSAITTLISDLVSTGYREIVSVAAGSTTDLATTTNTYDASSMAVGAGYSYLGRVDTIAGVLRLTMGGVAVADSAAITTTENAIVVGTRALSGEQIVKVSIYNVDELERTWNVHSATNGTPVAAGIAVGSIKAT